MAKFKGPVVKLNNDSVVVNHEGVGTLRIVKEAFFKVPAPWDDSLKGRVVEYDYDSESKVVNNAKLFKESAPVPVKAPVKPVTTFGRKT